MELHQYWENKRIENHQKELKIRREYLRKRRIIAWVSLIKIGTSFVKLSQDYKHRREEILLNRKVAMYTIKMVSRLLFLLKKKGPNYRDRTINTIQHGLS